MVLATAVIIRALHERANFYSACVYLAQSNACLMVKDQRCGPSLEITAHWKLGTHERCPPRGMYWYGWAPATLLRSSTSHRGRTALREGLVCHHGNVPRDDHIPRRSGRMVSGDVRLSSHRQGLGLDRGGSSRNIGTTATIKPTIVPRATLRLAHHLDTVRYLYASVLYKYGLTSCET